MPKKDPVVLRYTTQDIVNNAQQDFLETVDKQEMVPISELSREMLTEKKYLKDLFECVARGKKDTDGDFYVEVITTLEKLKRKVIRRRFLWTYSCTTPTPGSAIYKYTRIDDKLDLLWDIPATDACKFLIDNKHLINPAGHATVLKTVMDYYDGTLLKRAKEYNGETDGPGVVIRMVNDDERTR